ncbi:hypothetical protein [Nigerium massiliense]|uniref:hypothetical protein n=1 Tax=Nigerium massiliense TaxID=1522317 RepID=UPI0006943166|nr:hypothetical protein [Nigerium massiliense]
MTDQPSEPVDEPTAAQATPLVPADPPKVGDFWLDARLTAAASGVVYQAHDDQNTPAMVLLLSEGAAGDAAARDRLAGAVNKLHIDTVLARGGHGQDEGRLGRRFRPEDDDPVGPEDAPLAPWVALAYDGSPAALEEGRRLLAEIDLSWLPNVGRASGPDYQHYWIEQGRPGAWRLWPLPWPGRDDRAGWMSVLASWLLMLLLMCLAVLIAILIFQGSPPQSPPPPVPTSASGSGSPSTASGSPSPQSGSPSPQSGSPSPASGSPSPGTSPTPPSKL